MEPTYFCSQECFKELISKHPTFISGYIEYWEFLSTVYKLQKEKAQMLFQEAKKGTVAADIYMEQALATKE